MSRTPSRRPRVRTPTTDAVRSPPPTAVRLLSWLVVSLALALPTAAHAQRRVEGVAALVGGTAPGSGVDVILLSDVTLRARMRLAGQTVGELPVGSMPDSLLRATLDELIGEHLIAREARRVQVANPSSRDVARERARLEQIAGGAERLRRLLDVVGAGTEEIETSARRRAIVTRFLQTNLEGTAEVTDAEVQRVFDSGEHPFIGQELEDARPALRVMLVRRALDSAVRRWVEVLRSRTSLRVVARFTD